MTVNATALSDAITATTVRASCAAEDLARRAGEAARDGARRLLPDGVAPDDDSGAQAAEYAMMSGVGVVIAAACIAILRRGDIIRSLITALVEVLISFVQSWFAA